MASSKTHSKSSSLPETNGSNLLQHLSPENYTHFLLQPALQEAEALSQVSLQSQNVMMVHLFHFIPK